MNQVELILAIVLVFGGIALARWVTYKPTEFERRMIEIDKANFDANDVY